MRLLYRRPDSEARMVESKCVHRVGCGWSLNRPLLYHSFGSIVGSSWIGLSLPSATLPSRQSIYAPGRSPIRTGVCAYCLNSGGEQPRKAQPQAKNDPTDLYAFP